MRYYNGVEIMCPQISTERQATKKLHNQLTDTHLKLLEKYGLLEQADNCLVRSYKAGETIHMEGETHQLLLLVVSGKAKVCTTATNGKDLVLTYYLSDGLIGDMELASAKGQGAASVVALSDFECLAIPYSNQGDLLMGNLTFLSLLAKGLSEKLLLSSKNYVSTALYTGEQRLCTYILEGAYKNFFQDNLTDVAATIGISYRHMFRLLKKLCEEEILQREDHGFFILDEDQLRNLSSEGTVATA